jgi:hypothetical protein
MKFIHHHSLFIFYHKQTMFEPMFCTFHVFVFLFLNFMFKFKFWLMFVMIYFSLLKNPCILVVSMPMTLKRHSIRIFKLE